MKTWCVFFGVFYLGMISEEKENKQYTAVSRGHMVKYEPLYDSFDAAKNAFLEGVDHRAREFIIFHPNE